jgi:mono/diheme cytochrome c family protein
VTEIPEHLLKRSRERRAALGLGGDDAGSEGDAPKSSETAPATTKSAAPEPAAPSGPAPRAAAPEPAAPPPPAKVHPTVIAAQRRRKIPFWAMAALSLMPIWVFMYARAVTDTAEAADGPIGLGAEIYGNCASCHGGAGGGGVGYAFTGGEVLETFPNIEDMVRYVYYGTGAYNAEGVEIYGNPDREGGPHVTGGMGNMPNFGSGTTGGSLTDYELVSVICHERYTLGGADPTSDEWGDEFDLWCSEESPIFSGLQGGEYDYTSPDPRMFGDVEVMPVGPVPVPGSAG